MKRKHTSVGTGGGICCSGKACRGNQRHRTCSKRFEGRPWLIERSLKERKRQKKKEGKFFISEVKGRKQRRESLYREREIKEKWV